MKSLSSVNFSRSHICPVVRGKETKRVEFEAKVIMIQVDEPRKIEKLPKVFIPLTVLSLFSKYAMLILS